MQSNTYDWIKIFETGDRLEMMKMVKRLKFQVLYVCRSVKDAAVSYYHHETLMKSHDLQSDFVTYAR